MAKRKPELYLTYRIDILSTGAIRIANGIYERTCGLNVRDLRILRLIDDAPDITFTELVDRSKLERTQTSRLLNKLIKMKLVRRTLAGDDARQFYLQTTKAGSERRRLAGVVGDKIEETFLNPLSDVQQKELIRSLEILTQWVYGEGENALQALQFETT